MYIYGVNRTYPIHVGQGYNKMVSYIIILYYIVYAPDLTLDLSISKMLSHE